MGNSGKIRFSLETRCRQTIVPFYQKLLSAIDFSEIHFFVEFFTLRFVEKGQKMTIFDKNFIGLVFAHCNTKHFVLGDIWVSMTHRTGKWQWHAKILENSRTKMPFLYHGFRISSAAEINSLKSPPFLDRIRPFIDQNGRKEPAYKMCNLHFSISSLLALESKKYPQIFFFAG